MGQKNVSHCPWCEFPEYASTNTDGQYCCAPRVVQDRDDAQAIVRQFIELCEKGNPMQLMIKLGELVTPAKRSIDPARHQGEETR